MKFITQANRHFTAKNIRW